MTKPQFSTEPSMEDILASIRKMISEERLGPRPIPDQIGRSPFGESIAESPAAGPADLGPNLGAGIGPDPGPSFERTPAPAERAPSFSSLSDALKAATPSPEQRLTLEDKIADMLETDDETPRRPVSRTDSLAVFAATRPGPVNVPGSGPLGAASRSSTSPTDSPEPPLDRKTPDPEDDAPFSQTARPVSGAPQSPLNGMHHREARGLPPGPAPSAPKVSASMGEPKRTEPAGSKLAEPKLPEPKLAEAKPAEPKDIAPKETSPNKADTQRVIAMPPRPGATVLNGAGLSAAPTPSATATNGSHNPGLNGTHGPAINGANVASLGLHAFAGGAQGLRPSLREGGSPSGKRLDNDATDTGLSAKAPDGKVFNGPRFSESKPSEGLQAKSGDDAFRGKTDDRPETPANGLAKGAHQSPRDEPAKPQSTPSALEPAPVDARTETPAATASGLAPRADAPATKSTPSDALIDAVVAMVHKEPDTLSVFTSGSAFINGCTDVEPVRKPGPNMGRKLDRGAAELLRPMLRQWLSENMPRIVEDALRSELMSSQPEAEDSDEA